jgi:regulator of sigma D
VSRDGNGNWINEERHLLKNYRSLLDVSSCSVCGETRRVIAHHLDGKRTHNTHGNLKALCHWCHTTVHYLAKMRTHDHLSALMELSSSLS